MVLLYTHGQLYLLIDIWQLCPLAPSYLNFGGKVDGSSDTFLVYIHYTTLQDPYTLQAEPKVWQPSKYPDKSAR
jgi:hypothetical protein